MEIRAVTLDDSSSLHQLTRRWETHWEVPMVTPFDEIKDELTAPYMDLDLHTKGYWYDGRMVAYGRVWHRPSGEVQERAYLQGIVDPEYRGRGIGRELLGWQKATATDILRSANNDLPKYIRADEWEWIQESHRMYRRFGLEPVRYFSEMVKLLEGREEVTIPTGVQIRSYQRSDDEATLSAHNAAFLDHWGSTPMGLESFQHQISGPGCLLEASFVAETTGEVIGYTINHHFPEDEELLGRRDGWIGTLGVRREWRGRGVATALLKTSFNAFVDRGLTHSTIGVDTESPTDALRLYTNLGYEPTHRTITSETRIE